MSQNDSSLSAGAGATTGGTPSTSATGTTSPSDTIETDGRSPSMIFAGSSDFSDTSRPTGSSTTSSFTGGTTTVSRAPEARTETFESSSSQTIGGTVDYEERSRTRPNASIVVGAALAGAIAGGAIPFMLAGRKSSQKSASLEGEYSGSATASFDRDTSLKR